jgi:hypothetical protein
MGIPFPVVLLLVAGKTKITSGTGIGLTNKLRIDQFLRRIGPHLDQGIMTGEAGDLFIHTWPFRRKGLVKVDREWYTVRMYFRSGRYTIVTPVAKGDRVTGIM